MTNSLQGKRALVCGGSRGIGRGCAIELARAGAKVTVVARSEANLIEVVGELSEGTDQSHTYISADFCEPEALQRVIAANVEKSGPIQILVNNTGGPAAGPLLEATSKQLVAALTNHLLCNQMLAQVVVSGMKEAGYGRIINIISTSVIAPIKGLGVSNVTRGAVANWGRALSAELAPFGITVNNVLPGYTDTDRLKSIFRYKADKTGVSAEEIERAILDSIPMHRLGDPRELGATVAFLASPAASYINGVNLPVDGGRTASQ